MATNTRKIRISPQLKKAGRTNNEIAAALGCSVSALYNGIFNKEEK